jgi:hypothetical protein
MFRDVALEVGVALPVVTEEQTARDHLAGSAHIFFRETLSFSNTDTVTYAVERTVLQKPGEGRIVPLGTKREETPDLILVGVYKGVLGVKLRAVKGPEEIEVGDRVALEDESKNRTITHRINFVN